MPEKHNNETMYLFVTVGSRTERGVQIARVKTEAESDGTPLGRVDDVAACNDKPFALVRSRLSNGDTITGTLSYACEVAVRVGEPVSSLFDPGYTLTPDTTVNGADNHA